MACEVSMTQQTEEALEESPTRANIGKLEQLVDELEKAKMSRAEDKKLTVIMEKLRNAKLRSLQQSAVDVTLDPATAHALLVLSDDGKQVYKGAVRRSLPDNPERFALCFGVLGKQGLSTGTCYYEVEARKKTFWRVGVALKSVNRKERVPLCPTNGFWTISVINGDECFTGDGKPVSLPFGCLQKVGVFVDYEEGLVSFFDVEHKCPIYSFTGCCFTDAVYPYFGQNSNEEKSSPLIIASVNQTN